MATTNISSPETEPKVEVEQRALDRWAQIMLRINHLNGLVQQAIRAGSLERARALSERGRVAAWGMFNELLIVGANNAACDPEFPYVHWHRGLAFEALDQPEEARRQFDAFAQGLIAVGKPVSDRLGSIVREKLDRYGLSDFYPVTYEKNNPDVD